MNSKLAFYISCVAFLALYAESKKLTIPIINNWTKRSKESGIGGCKDPTEPFQCLGSSTCISLQFLCDGQPDDCPNNSDEDEALCTALKRPPKDFIRRFLIAQYTNYGSKFIEYIFGSKAASLFSHEPVIKSVDTITIALIVSPTIEQFSKVFEMNEVEMNRFANVIESIHNGQLEELPSFVKDSAKEGLSTLTEQLMRTNFLKNYNSI